MSPLQLGPAPESLLGSRKPSSSKALLCLFLLQPIPKFGVPSLMPVLTFILGDRCHRQSPRSGAVWSSILKLPERSRGLCFQACLRPDPSSPMHAVWLWGSCLTFLILGFLWVGVRNHDFAGLLGRCKETLLNAWSCAWHRVCAS